MVLLTKIISTQFVFPLLSLILHYNWFGKAHTLEANSATIVSSSLKRKIFGKRRQEGCTGLNSSSAEKRKSSKSCDAA